MIRIALADDHTLFRKSLAHLLLEEADFEVVIEARSGNQLLAEIAQTRIVPDLCILDVNMPDGNGVETLRQLKESYPDVGVLILTMLDHEALILQMLRLGAGGFLLKEDEPEEMIRAVRSVVNDGFYHSELISDKMMRRVKGGKEMLPETVSARERTFLELCVSELVYKEIATEMGVSLRTVHSYRDSLFEKLQIKSRTGLALFALRAGIVPLKG